MNGKRCVSTTSPEMLPFPSNADRHSISYERLEYMAAGRSGIVYGINDQRILKEYQESREGDVERRAYERLGVASQYCEMLGEYERWFYNP